MDFTRQGYPCIADDRYDRQEEMIEFERDQEMIEFEERKLEEQLQKEEERVLEEEVRRQAKKRFKKEQKMIKLSFALEPKKKFKDTYGHEWDNNEQIGGLHGRICKTCTCGLEQGYTRAQKDKICKKL